MELLPVDIRHLVPRKLDHVFNVLSNTLSEREGTCSRRKSQTLLGEKASKPAAILNALQHAVVGFSPFTRTPTL